MIRSPKERPKKQQGGIIPPEVLPRSVVVPPNFSVEVDENNKIISISPPITKDGKMKVNFAAVATDFTPRPAGDYEGTLISHKMNAASATSGNPTVTLDWSENESPNKHMFKTYSLQPKALWSLKRDLIRAGADVEDMNSEEADLDDIIQGLYGHVATLVFGEPREYTDKEGNPKLGDNFLELRDPTK